MKSKIYFTTCLFVILFSCFACRQSQKPSPYPAPAESRDGKWIQDVNYIYENLIRLHKNPFHAVTHEELEQFKNDLIDSIPNQSDLGIKVKISEFVAMLRDGHSRCPVYQFGMPDAGIKVLGVSDGYYVYSAANTCSELLNGKIIRIADHDVDHVLAQFGRVISHENPHGIKIQAPDLFRKAHLMFELELIPSPSEIPVTVVKDGEEISCIVPVKESWAAEDFTTIDGSKIPPAFMNAPSNYFYELMDDGRALYLSYNSCYEDPHHPFKDFANDVLHELKSPEIKKMIIDLRRNGGGSQIVAWPLFKKLKSHRLDHPGGILVLIGHRTFSSAKGNAMDLQEWTHATLIGNPTAQKHHSYGEIKEFNSPNFKLNVSYSTKYFQRGDPNASALTPDIIVPHTYDEVINGTDSVLNAALYYKQE